MDNRDINGQNKPNPANNEQKFGKSIQLDELSYKPQKLATLEKGNQYRDAVSNIDKKGNRIWIYPTQPKGDYYNKRTIVSIVLLAILFINPFISVGGHPLFLFNILDRTFIIFGVLFYPQDFHLFAMAFLAFVFFIVLFTSIFGRVWCGWACPQTIFMEMVFRKIEYWIDGGATEQKILDRQAMNPTKFKKRALKFTIFYLISFVIANLLLAYVVGIKTLSGLITEGPIANSGLFISVISFSIVFFSIFTWFREQACIYVCPYGRLQSVLLDENSIVVAYDHKRGEKREKFKKKQSEDAGDCIDCYKCVQVCPTGIDIRNGTQLECVNCTACMDACDAVMTQIGRPTQLIKYASIDQIEKGTEFKITPRIMVYTGILIALLATLVYLLSVRTDVEATILRAKGALYTVDTKGDYSNLFTMRITNKTYNDVKFDLKTNKYNGTFQIIGGQEQMVKAGEMYEATFILTIPKAEITQEKNNIKILVLGSNGEIIDEQQTIFMGPEKK